MNFAPLFGSIVANAAIQRSAREQRNHEEGLASSRKHTIERFDQLENEAQQSMNGNPITPLDDLAQPWLSDNYTVREIRAAGAMAVTPSEAEQAFATPWSSSTTNSSPITPPPELVTSLCNSVPHQLQAARELWLINHAYTAGANQELEACLANIHTTYGKDRSDWLRLMRRPKPPSLKEQALAELEEIMTELHDETGSAFTASAIRRALEALND
jgi:hypothetical protein